MARRGVFFKFYKLNRQIILKQSPQEGKGRGREEKFLPHWIYWQKKIAENKCNLPRIPSGSPSITETRPKSKENPRVFKPVDSRRKSIFVDDDREK